MAHDIIRLAEAPEMIPEAARCFHEWWGVPEAAYLDSMRASGTSVLVPQWYVIVEGSRIIGGLGVIENDFHDQRAYAPNVCAVYVVKERRGRGLAGELLARACDDFRAAGYAALYLVTDHSGFYERYGWEYLREATSDGAEQPSRLYGRALRGWLLAFGQ